MKSRIVKSLSLLALVACIAACNKDNWPEQPDWSKIPAPGDVVDDNLSRPASCDNHIVAHRCGASESGLPDNSIASLKYAMSLGVYGAECDVYWTKDDNIVVAHANGSCQINNLEPHAVTLQELRAAGKLSNGEVLPSLEDMLDALMQEGSCTRLIIDIKKIDYPVAQPEYVIKAAERVCKIVEEKGAKHWVHLHCTGSNASAMKSSWGYAQQYGLEIAMNSGKSASDFAVLGYNWISLSAAGQMGSEFGGSGSRTLKEYIDAGIAVSVYNVDKKAGDSNSVYSDAAVAQYIKNYAYFKTISTNYPSWLMSKVSDVGVSYDSICDEDSFNAFQASLISDPSGSAFCSGEINLTADLTLNDFSPLSKFTGIFNGNGHTLTINSSGTSGYTGFVKELGGTIKNLTIAGTIKTTALENVYAAAFASTTTSGAAFSNCTNKANIIVESSATSGVHYTGSLAALASGSVSFTDCTDCGNISISDGAVVWFGGMLGGTKVDDGYIRLKNCSSSATINFSGGNDTGAWHYVGGLLGKIANTTLSGSDYHLIMEGCSFSGTYNINGNGKVRGAQLCSYTKCLFAIKDSNCSGTISNTNPASRDIVIGGTVGFVENKTQGLIQNCSFSGRTESVSGANNYCGGLLANTGSSLLTIDACKTTSTAYVSAGSVKSIGMIAARSYTTDNLISNCLIAGTIDNAGTVVKIDASNIADWMFSGSASNATATLQENGYNNN